MAPVRRANGFLIYAAVVLGAAVWAATAGDQDGVCFEQHVTPGEGWFGYFGQDSAMSGTTAVVGRQGGAPGAVYVYDRSSGEWAFVQQIVGSQVQPGDFFGRRVDIDDSVMVASTQSGTDQVYMFRYDGASWVEEQILPGPPDTGSNFGNALAVRDDLAIIGEGFTSKAHVYRYDGTNWNEEQVLMGEPGGVFGWSVATDGQRIFVGDVSDSEACSPTLPDCNSGAIFVFAFDEQEQKWVETHKILLPLNDAGWSPAVGWLGRAIAIDGDRLIAGSNRLFANAFGGQSVCTHPQCGHALIYRYESDADEWVFEAALGPNHPDVRFFGEAVAIEGDTVVVGARQGNITGFSSGSAHVFRRNAEGEWVETHMLTPLPIPGANNKFGRSVGLSNGLVVIGADGENSFTGGAYFFDVSVNPADLDCDGAVGVADLLILLSAWGSCPEPVPLPAPATGTCPADLTGDNQVGVADLLVLLANWGSS